MLKFICNKYFNKKFIRITPTHFGWGYGYGFFSNYRVCLQQLISNHLDRKLIPYVDWRNTTWVEGIDPMKSKKLPKNQENPFDYWFDQTIPQKNDGVKLSNGKLDFKIIDHAINYFKDDRLVIQQEVDKLYLKPKKEILDKVDKLYLNNLKGEVVLGVMARGSEYNKHHPFYGVFGINDYIDEIKKVLKKRPNITKIFIVSEDLAYIEKISSEFSETYFVPNVFRRTDESLEYVEEMHHWCNISQKRKNHTKLLGEEVIIQTKLLAKCNYLLGRHSGVFCGAILWNQKIEEVFSIDINAHSTNIIK